MIESIEGKRGEPRLRPPYVAQVGLFGRPTLEHNMETLHWVRDILEKGPAWFAGHGRNGRKGLRSFSVSGRVKKPGVHLAPAGITLQELIDEYCGGMLDGHDALRLPAGRRVGRHPAGVDGRRPARLRHAERSTAASSARRRSSCCRTTTRAAGAARNVMKFFADESCGQCTPCRVGTAKALQLMERAQLGPAAAEGAVAGDDGRVDLRPGPGGAEPGADRAEILSRRKSSRCIRRTRPLATTPVSFTLNGQTVVAPSGRDDPRDRRAARHRDSAPLLHGGHARRTATAAPAWWRSRASACWRRPAAAIPKDGHGGHDQQRARARPARRCRSSCCSSDMPETSYTLDSELDHWAKKLDDRQAALRARASSRPRTCRIRRWPCTSTPASSASAACAPAARSRSTTSSATPSAAATRRSCSTSTIRWATRPASPAASACRRARPAR